MAILKCKICGGDIELSADKTFGTCESCGSTMTFPKVDDEQRANAFNRGNHFRRMGEFDKALAVYERIVQEDENDAEAHWCCALCRFGIEYVEDPNTFEYLPTCHRASFDSFLEDVDYLAALEHSEGITRRQYQKDAQKIAEVQRGILATSQNEEPFDVFICYKESENDGSRTRDSLMAQEIYYQLTEQGRRIFFSRITLEDKAGTEYEPYIFAALNSAKVMIVVTTSAEHANAVWVKNEWSRFLSLMRKDRTKLLLPCYRDMDPYDLPEALSVLQSYDMSKIGFIQDLIRGVNKVLDASKPKETVKETVVVQPQANANVAPLLKRAFMFLEDGDWNSANEYCEKVLDLDPENAEAYICKLLVDLRIKEIAALQNAEPFDKNVNYLKAMRFLGKYPDSQRCIEVRQCAEQIQKDQEFYSAVQADDFSLAEEKALLCSNFERTFSVEGIRIPVLQYLIRKGQAGLIRILLKKGADVNSERILASGDKYSALRDSIAEWPNDEIAHMLIDAGADVNYIERQDGSLIPVLNSAIYKQNVGITKLLLEKGANPNNERVLASGEKYSALADSIGVWPNDEIANMLIDAGADADYVERCKELNCPVLISAIVKGNAGMVKKLLEKGADPNCERVFDSGSRYSALRDSIIQWPNDEIANMLIDAGADVNYVETGEKVNIPILINAIIKGNAGMVKKLLEKGADPNCERVFHSGSRYSALRDSIFQWSNNEIANMLIDAGADVNYVEHSEKLNCPVLISAIAEGNVDMVKKLLEKGADPNCERAFHNGARYSALRDSIAEWPNDKIANMLIDAGADVNYIEHTANGSQIQVLNNAICKQNVEITRRLLEKGADPNSERVLASGEKYSALGDSIFEWPNDEIANMLIDAGADVNYVVPEEKADCPVLISAIIKGNAGMVKKLLEKGADPNSERVLKTGGKYSALVDSIAVWPNDEIAHMLIDAGANVDYVSRYSDGKMPVLISAIKKQNESVVKHLLEKGANPVCSFIPNNHIGGYDAKKANWLNGDSPVIAKLLRKARRHN